MAKYEVEVQRDGKFWYVAIPALDGATQARRANEIHEMARDYIAEVTGEVESDIELDVHFILPEQVAELIAEAETQTAAEAFARRAAADARVLAAKALQDDGLTVTEVGTVMGVSKQRASQLVSSK